jgi:hypothetical protein
MRDPYITELATTVNEMFAEGVNDPSATEIARRHWGDDKVMPRILAEDVRRRLGRVRTALEEDGHLMCPLSETYYQRYRRPGKLKTQDEARRCLAIGRGRQQVGLLRLTGTAESDLIWTQWASIQCNQAAGKAGRALNGVLAAVDGDKVSVEQGHEILLQADRLAQPARPEVAERVMRALPPTASP